MIGFKSLFSLLHFSHGSHNSCHKDTVIFVSCVMLSAECFIISILQKVGTKRHCGIRQVSIWRRLMDCRRTSLDASLHHTQFAAGLFIQQWFHDQCCSRAQAVYIRRMLQLLQPGCCKEDARRMLQPIGATLPILPIAGFPGSCHILIWG